MRLRAKTLVLTLAAVLVLLVVGGLTAVGWEVVLGPKEEQIDTVLHGRKGTYRPNTEMPPQAALSDVDLAAAITFTRHSFGNKAQEGVVQPSEVKARRK